MSSKTLAEPNSLEEAERKNNPANLAEPEDARWGW